MDKARQTAEIVAGRFPQPRGPKGQLAVEFIRQNRELFRIQNPARELKQLSEEQDAMGMTHIRFDQEYNEVPVWGCQKVVHFDTDGAIYLVAGQTIPTPSTNTVPTIRANEAERLAAEIVTDRSSIGRVKSRLVIYPQGETSRLTWLVSVHGKGRHVYEWNVFVDAHTGELVHRYNGICTDGPAVGSGKDVFDTTRILQTYQIGGAYKLVDASHPMYQAPITNLQGVIATYNYWREDHKVLISDPNNDNVFNDNEHMPAEVAAHYFTQRSYDYFLNTFGRDSWDDSGITIIVSAHDSAYGINAYYDGSLNYMGFSDGDADWNPFSADLDVVAHEYTHGVTQYTAGLIYEFESGALNESMSDFFGNMVDRTNWLIGDGVYKPAPGYLRSMSDPHQGYWTPFWFGAQPAHLDEMLDTTVFFDNGGVHINSGIPNKVAYLASTAIGREKAEQIWYRTLSVYLTPSSSFYYWAAMLSQATADLYGSTGPELVGIMNALDDVGFPRILHSPDEVVNIILPPGTSWDSTIVVRNRGVGGIDVTSATAARGLVTVTGPVPTTLSFSDSATYTVSYQTAPAGDQCDIGGIQDTLVLVTTSPVQPIIRVPITITSSYVPTRLDTTTFFAGCMHVAVNNRGTFEYIDPRLQPGTHLLDEGFGSLVVSTVIDGDTILYSSLHNMFRPWYQEPNLLVVDTFVRSQTDNGDSLWTLRFVSVDRRLYVTSQYRFQSDTSGCGWVMADYWLTNPCNESYTAFSGLLFEFEPGLFEKAGYHASQKLVYSYSVDGIDDFAAGVTMLSGTPRNLRAINKAFYPGGEFRPGYAYTHMSQTTNQTGHSVATEHGLLLTFGQDTMQAGKTAHYQAAIAYSTVDSLDLFALVDRLHTAQSCCEGTTGNLNMTGVVDLSDLSLLIGYMTIGGVALPCPEEANVNNSGIIDLTDLSLLIAYLTVPAPGKPSLPACP